MDGPSARSGNSGITLIELIVALGIGLLVVATVLLAHRALTGQSNRLTRAAHEQKVIEDTFLVFSEELQRLFLPPKDDACLIELDNNRTNLVILAFCRWTPITKSTSALPTQQLERITFKHEPVGEAHQLIKVSQCISGRFSGEPPRTNLIGTLWPNTLVHLYDGKQWRTNWTTKVEGVPTMARIQLVSSDGGEVKHESMVIIPAGLSVTSRLANTISP